GTKFGIGYDTASPEALQPNRIDVSARAARSTMGYTRVSGSVAVRPVPAPIEINVGAQKYEFPQEDFFGFGASSLKSNRTDYLLKSTDVGADMRWTPRRSLAFTAGVSRLRPETGEGTD